MSHPSPLRFGLVGTGYWAQETHARAITETDGIELAAIWGRDPDRTRAAAARFEVPARLDFDEFLADVDAVSFAVPPAVQSNLALRAIDAGKHVLFEKPPALSLAEANDLVAATEARGVSTIVFFTLLFDPRIRRVVEASVPGSTWSGGQGLWLGSALRDENPFNTPWRHEKGALWDLGPHALSVLWTTIGPIESVHAEPGIGDLVHLVFGHRGGATSTATMTLRASDAADGFATVLWGESGREELTVDDVDEPIVLRNALTELAENVRAGQAQHPCDIRFGRDIVAVLAEAERSLAGSR